MIQAAIFDFDGTVIDSTQNDYEAWKKLFKEYQVDFSYEEYIRVLGAKGADIVKNHLDLEQAELDAMLDRKEKYFKQISEEKPLQLIPGVFELLEEIRNIPLKIALATGTSLDKLNFIFDKVEIKSFFDAIVTADDVHTGKPDPEVFVKAAEKLGVNPAEAVVFEDATLGVKAAKACDMHCIAITTTRGKEELTEADLVIDQYKELDFKKWMKTIPGVLGA